MIVSPPSLSLGLWWRLVRQNKTLLRSMEDELISQLHLHGRILDVGGGPHFSYVSKMRTDDQLHYINICLSVEPTIVANLNSALPILDDIYDNVLCFNTLEHVYEDRLCLKELLRVLKPGGRFVLTVPFLFPQHGRYGDYHRHTAQYWELELCSLGLDKREFIIQPLLYSPFSSAFAILPWFRGGIRCKLLKAVVLFAALFSQAMSLTPANFGADYALGFYIDGVKPR